ncbi:MAG: adenylate/guanylate cyclase domain-containing protein, partial [Vicinamibacterales bacterium]
MSSFRARLEQHGLGKYIELFAEHGIDFDVLAELTDADLEKLGLPLGDRRRILKAAAALAQAPATYAIGEGRKAERRQLTVMFADLVDSTKLATRLDPEDMKDVIAKYQKAVGDEVVRFGGYVAKPLGDGLLIYFGWPQAHEDDAERSLRSAISAIAAVGKLRTPAGDRLGARIGIATGEVVVGDFTGAGVSEEGAVVGETPNLAARLQSLAGENAIVVAERTLRLVGGQFAFTDLGAQNLKGFQAPVRAWRLDSERRSESRFNALHGSRLGKFIGREHEMGSLVERWRDACDGECQLLLIAGEAGIGKSRLVSEFLSSLEAEPHSQIWYQASPLHTNTALYPIIRHLEAKAGFNGDDTGQEKYRKLAATIPSQAPRDRLALKYLTDLMSLEWPDEGPASGSTPSADEQREAAFAALVADTGKDSALVPVLIVMEDAHWLDATTQEFLDRVLDGLQHHRVMMLVTYRPEFVPPWAQHANVGLLSLSRLGRRSSLAIVNSLISS